MNDNAALETDDLGMDDLGMEEEDALDTEEMFEDPIDDEDYSDIETFEGRGRKTTVVSKHKDTWARNHIKKLYRDARRLYQGHKYVKRRINVNRRAIRVNRRDIARNTSSVQELKNGQDQIQQMFLLTSLLEDNKKTIKVIKEVENPTDKTKILDIEEQGNSLDKLLPMLMLQGSGGKGGGLGSDPLMLIVLLEAMKK